MEWRRWDAAVPKAILGDWVGSGTLAEFGRLAKNALTVCSTRVSTSLGCPRTKKRR